MYPKTLSIVVLSGSLASAQSPLPDLPARASSPKALSSLFWGDYDRDGLPDAWVVQPDGSGRLLRNAGDGTFEDVSGRAGVADLKGAHMAVWADANGDGRLDLYLAAYRGASRLLLQTEAGTFEDATEASGLPKHAEPLDALWFDYDGDRRPDLWLTTLHDDLVYHNAGDGRFERVDLGLVPRVAPPETEPPLDVNRAREMRGLDPIEGDTTVNNSSSGPGAPTGTTTAQLVCTIAIQDTSSPTNCLPASSDPLLGHLYPISADWFVESGTGNVGIGTTTPGAKLDVAGDVRADGQLVSAATTGAPLSVASSDLVAGLNADQLDGFDASAFSQLGNSIGNAELEPDSVMSLQILDDSVTIDDLGVDSVGSAEIIAGAVGASELAVDSVTSGSIVDGTIVAADLSADAVSGATIVDDSITADDLAFGSVGASEIADGSIGGAELAANSVASAMIVDGSIVAADLSPFAITGDVIANNSVTGDDIADGSLASADIADLSILQQDLAPNSITNEKLTDSCITEAELAFNSVGSIAIQTGAVSTAEIVDGTINAVDLGVGSVTSDAVLNGSLMGIDLAPNSVGPFQIAPNAVGPGEIADGAIYDSDINGGAAIAGTKILPDFGSQNIVTTGSGSFEATNFTEPFGIKGVHAFHGPTRGYLGIQGSFDFDGVASADWAADEIGIAGISTGTTTPGDNYGVIGHSNGVGVRGEYSGNPSDNYGELGLNGIGVHATGTSAAADFDGRVLVDYGGVVSAVAITSTSAAPALNLQMTNGSTHATGLRVDHAGPGRAAHFTQATSATANPTVTIDSNSTSGIHYGLQVTAFDDGNAARFHAQGTGDGVFANADGGGYGGFFQSNFASAVALRANNVQDNGSIIEASNGGDIEFRADSSGNVFCDVAFIGGGADYAEWLERAVPTETFRPGDVVGVDGGRISKDLAGAQQIMVISTNPVVVGNNVDASEDERTGHEMVAFLGQVPVRVRGPVREGDLVLPSGRDDGTAVAVSPRDVRVADLARVIGTAWEGSDDDGIHLVNCAIGIDQSKASAFVVGRLQADVGALEERVASDRRTLEERISALEAIVAEVLPRR